MTALNAHPPPKTAPFWLRAAAILGLAWNLFGVYQYIGTFTAAGQAAMTAGMTPEQAQLYLGLPAWISVVFAIGVFTGLAGSLALALRRRMALPMFVVSLIAYVLLFAGDLYHGVFAAIPVQLAILAAVVLIAAGLLWITRIGALYGFLR